LLKPNYITRRFRCILEKNNLKLIRFHDLRHTCASLLYANEVDRKKIQEWLGHSSIGTTMNIYTHLSYQEKKTSAEIVDGIMKNAFIPPSNITAES